MYQNKNQSLMKSSNCEYIEDKYFLEMPRGLYLSQFLYETSGNIFYNYNHLLMQKYTANMISTGTCTPFSKKLFLSVDGKILPCERIEHDFELGHVNGSLVELDYKVVAEKHNFYLKKIANLCAKCSMTSSCSQCMYHIDDIREKNPRLCYRFCTSEKLRKEKEELFSYLRNHPDYYKRILKEVTFSF